MPHFPKPAEGSWTQHYPHLGTGPISNADFERSCTPGYYNNEGGGGGEGIRSHLGEPYGPGFYAFGELLAQWRATGNMEGMELRS
jgi:cyclohexanone monooxygenase